MQTATEQRRNKETGKKQFKKKELCIIGGESETLGFHQETTEESRKRQDRFCRKNFTLYFFTRLPS